MEKKPESCYREVTRDPGRTPVPGGPHDEHQTGVGTPDAHVEAGGASLGGDTGDVGIPRDELAIGPGDPHGVSAEAHEVPQAVERVECKDGNAQEPTMRERRERQRRSA